MVRKPLLSSYLVTEKPGTLVGTMKAEMPLAPAVGSVAANTQTMSASPPLVMKHFSPLMTHSSPSLTAVVRTLEASEPDWGSVRAKAA